MDDRLPRRVQPREIALLGTALLTVLTGSMLAPALPRMTAAYAAVPHAELLVKLVLTAPALGIVLAAPLAGWFLDHLGRKPVLVVAMLLFAVAGSSGLYLDSLYAILAGRVLLGVSAAGIRTACTTLIGDFFEGRARRRLMGWQTTSRATSSVVFLLAGGALAGVGWRAPFGMYLASLAVLPFMLLFIEEPARHGGEPSEAPGPVGGRAQVRVGRIALVYATGMVGRAFFYLVPTEIPLRLHTIAGSGELATAVAIAAMTATAALSSLFYERIKRRLSFEAVFGVVFALMGVGYLTVFLAQGYWETVAGLILSGPGFGLMMPNLSVWLLSEAPEPVRGRLTGGMTMCVFFGQFAAPLLAEPLLGRIGSGGVFAVAAALMLILAVAFARGRAGGEHP